MIDEYDCPGVQISFPTRTKALLLSLSLCPKHQALAKSVEDGGKARQATESQLQQWQARESTLLLEQVGAPAGWQC